MQKGKQTVPLDPAGSSSVPRPHEPIAPEVTDYDHWVRFHEAVDQLPIEEREVVGLVFYHGWTQEQIAELFQVDERTIRRRWSSACKKIRASAGAGFREGLNDQRVASTRRSPSRRVSPTRSRYSQIGTANLRVVPSRSRISATVAPGPDCSRSRHPPAHLRLGLRRQVDLVGHLHQQPLGHRDLEDVPQRCRVAAGLVGELLRLGRLEPGGRVRLDDPVLQLPLVGAELRLEVGAGDPPRIADELLRLDEPVGHRLKQRFVADVLEPRERLLPVVRGQQRVLGVQRGEHVEDALLQFRDALGVEQQLRGWAAA